MGKRVKKIPIERIESGGMRKDGWVRKGNKKVRHLRKESNNDLLTQAYNHRGSIRLNILLRIKHWETGNYAGWNGSAIMVDAASPAKATEFYAEFKKAVVEVAQRLGMDLPGAIVVEG